jgi:hypothetical protein
LIADRAMNLFRQAGKRHEALELEPAMSSFVEALFTVLKWEAN